MLFATVYFIGVAGKTLTLQHRPDSNAVLILDPLHQVLDRVFCLSLKQAQDYLHTFTASDYSYAVDLTAESLFASGSFRIRAS